MSTRNLLVTTVGCLATFVCALMLAAMLYVGPAGAAPGSFSLAHNYWCDLLHSTTPDARASRWAARVAFIAFGLGCIPYWNLAGRLNVPPCRRVVQRSGEASGLLCVLLVALPSDQFPALHAPVALLATTLAVGSTLLHLTCPFTYPQLRRGPWRSGLLALGLAVATALLFIGSVYLGMRGSEWIPSLQKLATLSTLVWMSLTLRAAHLASLLPHRPHL